MKKRLILSVLVVVTFLACLASGVEVAFKGHAIAHGWLAALVATCYIAFLVGGFNCLREGLALHRDMRTRRG